MANNWCEEDKHNEFMLLSDFNEWFDSEDGELIRDKYQLNGTFSNPSKAFFAGDRQGYNQAFAEYRKDRIEEALSKTFLCELLGDEHWYDINVTRFEQLCKCLQGISVVPFVGAGISVDGGFDTWKGHLKHQGRTAGINPTHLNSLLAKGLYENVIEEIENKSGRDVFVQEIRDSFSKTGKLTNTVLLISELFSDTIITTNYDGLIEKTFDTGIENAYQIINGTNPLEDPLSDRVTIIKLHGDIKSPAKCILSKNQYNQAYGENSLDLTLPIPKLLNYYFINGNLLFLGCSLNNDRTVEVFQAINRSLGDEDRPQHFSLEQTPENEDGFVARNAELLKMGVTAIWFEKGAFDRVECILRLARNEVNYSSVIG